jgi:membrane-associated phospholipid phosphatase
MLLSLHACLVAVSAIGPLRVSLEPTFAAVPPAPIVEAPPPVDVLDLLPGPDAADASDVAAEGDGRAAGRAGPLRRAGRFLVAQARHQKELVLAPAGMRGGDWARWAPPLAAAGLLMADRESQSSLDEDLTIELAEVGASKAEWVRGFSRLGDGDVTAVLWGATWLAARASGQPRFRETVNMTGEALLDSALLSHGMKLAFGRARPRASADGSYPGGPARAIELGGSASFPSGHAMAAVAVATVIAERHGNRPWVPPLAYTMAAGVAASRVWGEHHYLSDIIAGGVIGHGVGRLVLRRHGQAPRARNGRWDWQVVPAWAPSQEEISLSVTVRPKDPPAPAR